MAIERILRAMQSEILALQPEKIEQIAQVLEEKFRTGKIATATEIEAADNAQRRGIKTHGAIAVIPLFGTIARRMSAMEASSGGQSLDTFAESFRGALTNDQVSSILIDVHSPGGSVYGVDEVARMVADGAKQKRVVAIADQLMASAAYYIGAAAGELVVTPSAEVGSIGVYTVHFDYSEQAKELGIKVTIIKAGAKKAEGNPFEPLDADAAAHTQSIVDAYYSQFVRAVAKGRGVGVDMVRGEAFGQGRTFDSARAVQRGLADRVATVDETIADMQRKRWPNADGRAAVTVPAGLAAVAESPLDAIGPLVERATAILSGLSDSPGPQLSSTSAPVTAARIPWVVAVQLADDLTRERLERNAYHEAGHAVMAILSGAELGVVSLNFEIEDGRFVELGGVTVTASALGQMPASFFAAGFGAELEAGFSPMGSGWSFDLEDLKQHYAASGPALATAVGIARAQLRENWRAVTTVANGLLDHGKLDGPAATLAILANIGTGYRHLLGYAPQAGV